MEQELINYKFLKNSSINQIFNMFDWLYFMNLEPISWILFFFNLLSVNSHQTLYQMILIFLFLKVYLMMKLCLKIMMNLKEKLSIDVIIIVSHCKKHNIMFLFIWWTSNAKFEKVNFIQIGQIDLSDSYCKTLSLTGFNNSII